MKVSSILHGVAAAAAGTAVLNASTYADMAIRDRPPSKLPKKMVVALAERAGIPPPQGPRRTAYASLLGYMDGFATGALYGMVRPRMRGVPWFLAGIGLGAFTFVLSEGTATAMGQTDPREWSGASWAADIISRCMYGWVTALTFEQLQGGDG